MPKAIGHTEDLDNNVNSSYFVTIDGDQAASFLTWKITQEYLPPLPIYNTQTYMVNCRNYRTATSGYLIQASLSLECLRNSRGSYRCPADLESLSAFGEHQHLSGFCSAETRQGGKNPDQHDQD